MRLVCPSCGATHSSDAFQNDAKARQCLGIVAELPQSVSKHSLAYLSLFRPQTGAALQWGKVLRLLTDLRDMLMTGQVRHSQQVSRPCTADLWGQGLQHMIENPPFKLPLKNHNYLIKVVYDLADAVDRERENEKNRAIRNGSARQDRNNSDFVPITSAEMKAIREKVLGRRNKNVG